MAKLKIGVVENDFIIAESIIITLQQIGYQPTQPARNYDEALVMIEKEKPDLLLMDIGLDGKLDGIDLALKVNEDYGIPFIFLTANSDLATIRRAKKVTPNGYLVKPFKESDLFSSIEIAFSNYNEHKENQQNDQPVTYLKDIIFLKDKDVFHKVEIKDIIYVGSDNVYLNIYTDKKHYLVRAKLDDFVNSFPNADFFRIHRSYAINLKHLETINNNHVIVAGKEIPLNKAYKQELLKAINSLK